jgi:hypothetical protein
MKTKARIIVPLVLLLSLFISLPIYAAGVNSAPHASEEDSSRNVVLLTAFKKVLARNHIVSFDGHITVGAAIAVINLESLVDKFSDPKLDRQLSLEIREIAANPEDFNADSIAKKFAAEGDKNPDIKALLSHLTQLPKDSPLLTLIQLGDLKLNNTKTSSLPAMSDYESVEHLLKTDFNYRKLLEQSRTVLTSKIQDYIAGEHQTGDLKMMLETAQFLAERIKEFTQANNDGKPLTRKQIAGYSQAINSRFIPLGIVFFDPDPAKPAVSPKASQPIDIPNAMPRDRPVDGTIAVSPEDNQENGPLSAAQRSYPRKNPFASEPLDETLTPTRDVEPERE